MTTTPWLTDPLVVEALAACRETASERLSAGEAYREAQARRDRAEARHTTACRRLSEAEADSMTAWVEGLPMAECWAIPAGSRKPVAVQLHGEAEFGGWMRVWIPRKPGEYDRNRAKWQPRSISAEKPASPHGAIPGGTGRLWLATP